MKKQDIEAGMPVFRVVAIGNKMEKIAGNLGYKDLPKTKSMFLSDVEVRTFNEHEREVKEWLKGTDMVFIAAQLGESSRISCLIADMVRTNECTVVGIGVIPKGTQKEFIEKHMRNMKKSFHSVILVNDKRKTYISEIPLMIKELIKFITEPSITCMDYADVKNILTKGGKCSFSFINVKSQKPRQITEQAFKEMHYPVESKECSGILLKIIGCVNLALEDINDVGEAYTESLEKDGDVVWGARLINKKQGIMKVLTIATGA